MLLVSCCFNSLFQNFARISPEFHQKLSEFTGISADVCQNVELKRLKKEDNHNLAFPHCPATARAASAHARPRCGPSRRLDSARQPLSIISSDNNPTHKSYAYRHRILRTQKSNAKSNTTIQHDFPPEPCAEARFTEARSASGPGSFVMCVYCVFCAWL